MSALICVYTLLSSASTLYPPLQHADDGQPAAADGNHLG
jgi:hypothetical protein